MSIVAAYTVPHPPLIVPAVGRGEEAVIAETTAALDNISQRIAQHKPDTIVITSPHAPAFRDGFFVSQTPVENGSMATFGQPQEALSVHIDTQFAQKLANVMEQNGLLCAPARRGFDEIDHGTYVPLYFLSKAIDLNEAEIVRIGLSGLPDKDHKLLGELIAETANDLERKCVLVASGDWSHKLKPEGPYGFVPEGPKFDEELAGIFRSGELQKLFEMDPALREAAAECGLRSFQIMAGALEGTEFTAELLSYEGPFGVGYGVAAFEVVGSSNAQKKETDESVEGTQVSLENRDPLVALARATVDEYISTGNLPSIPSNFPEEYLNRTAGVFVSLHEHGNLRGCIGTISACQPSIAEEVIVNAVSASTSDPRFPAVRPDELDHLEYSVDVLGEPERIDSFEDLDPKKYGVIVTKGWKRGLLLPDLEGVDTAEDQVAIAKRKAGIALDEPVELERFEVIRHNVGGEARA